MTTLAACRVGSTYALAADRRVMFGNEHAARQTPKIRMVAPWLALGSSGTATAAAWLRALTVAPEQPATAGELQAVLDELGESLRVFCAERDLTDVSMCGITPLGIVRLTRDGAGSLLASQVFGDGSGSNYAMGAMHSRIEWPTYGSALGARECSTYGVAVASRFDAGTGGEIDVLTIEAAP
jgi:ATP-dependent protease HslVU (ClpYQ) peptidase subunit